MKLVSILTVASAVAAAQFAYAQEPTAVPPVGTQVTTQLDMPKPAFVINFNTQIEHVSSDKPDAIIYYNGREDRVVTDIINDTVTNTGKLVAITYDTYHLPANSSVKLTLPLLQVKGDATTAQTTKQEFTYTTGDFISITDASSVDYDKFSSDKSIIIEPGVEWEITKSVNCKQLVVKPTAGLTIPQGKVFMCADTAYFMAGKGTHYENAYIIPHGSFEAAASVVMHDISENTYYSPVSIPIQESVGYKNLSLYTKYIYAYDNFDYNVWNTNTTTETTHIFHGANDNQYGTFRFKGTILTDNETTLNALEGELTFPRYGIKNPYVGYIDLRNIYENSQADFFGYITRTASSINDQISYNAYSKLTTFDGPNAMGYLLPPTALAENYNAMWSKQYSIKTSDLISPSQIVKKYENDVIDFPYVRFYADYADANRKGIGKRHISAIYMIPQEEYDTKEGISSKRLTSKYDVRYTPDIAYISTKQDPLIVYTTENYGSINAVPEIALNETSEYTFRISSLKENVPVEIGILDTNMDKYGIDITCQGTSLLSNNTTITPTQSGKLFDGSDLDAYRKTIIISFTKSEDKKPTIIDENNIFAYKVYASGNRVYISSDTECQYIITNLSGIIIENGYANNCRKSIEINEKGIYFVKVISKNNAHTYKVLIQ